MSRLFDLSGKTAAVTGAGRGIGAELAVGLAEAGADIVAVGRKAPPEEVVARIKAAGRRVEPVQADLSRRDEAHDCAETLAAHPIDILVNNAGVIRRGPAVDHADEDWDAVLELNLTVPFMLSRKVATGMATRGWGRIVMIASMQSFRGGAGIVGYAAAKSGLPGLVRSLAGEWAAHGVAVNAIAPGYIRTDMTTVRHSDPAASSALLNSVPARRWGHPVDLVGATVFLSSAASDFVHGAVIPVDGGWLAS